MNNNISKLIKHGCLLAALGVFILPGMAAAQQYYDPGILQKTIDRKPVDYQPPPLRMGGFRLGTGAEFAYENNDNSHGSLW